MNVVKAGAKKTHKGFQKIKPVLNKVKPIVNPRNALFGFLIMSLLQPSAVLAAPNPISGVNGLPSWIRNVTVSILLAGMIEETTYHTACMVPGSQWFNSRIGAPPAAICTYGCASIQSFCHSVGWYTKGFKCISGTAPCTGYVIVLHLTTRY